MSSGNFTTIDHPGAAGGAEGGTAAGAINDRGQIVGNYLDASGIIHGFLLIAGSFSPIDVPGALDATEPGGIAAHGEIVGRFDDNNGTEHGFTLIAGKFSTVDYPGAGFTEAIRVNDLGQIVGSYILAGQHAYLATPNPIRKP